MSTMSEWIAEACRELDLTLADPRTTTNAVLDLTADVAHGVARPAAPVTAFLLGLAAGRADDPEAAVAELAARLSARATVWSSDQPANHPE
ncbi:MAG: hypothetical protein JO100_13295 [Pseudonocardia sp.]|nr:hypothetical protein [Pseudonocardia sp.]